MRSSSAARTWDWDRESVADFAAGLEPVRQRPRRADVLARDGPGTGPLAAIPMINALSDCSHPCQAMADLMTIEELKGPLSGKKLVFVGDGNNVARSLAVGLGAAGRPLRSGRAAGLRVPSGILRPVRRALSPGAVWSSSRIPARPSPGPTSFTPTSGRAWDRNTKPTTRKSASRPYQVNEELLRCADAQAIFMHCLPARRGEEVTSAVLDGPRSQVIRQAANRLHFQMALLVWLLGER